MILLQAKINGLKRKVTQYLCLCLCLRGEGEGGLLALCLEEVRGGGGGDKDGDLPRLFRSLRSLPGDLLDVLDEEREGDGVRRIRGGDGVTGTRFLYGDRDLRLLRGDLLRDLKQYNNRSY